MPPERIFSAMMREEWRLHQRLFPRSRFALFPVVITLLVAITTGALHETGTDVGRVYAGLHGLAFVFGLHTGSVALIGRDSVRNLLGDLTLLVFSARTLPLSERQLIGVFVIKDVAYYAGLFLMPMAVGVGGSLYALGVLGLPSVLGTILALWLGMSGMFVLGLVLTVAGIGVVNMGVPRWAAVVAFAVVAGGLWGSGFPVTTLTAYGAFVEPTVANVLFAVAAIALIGTFGALTFDPDPTRSARTVRPTYRRWRRRLRSPVATRSLLDLHRSSGGFAKVLFSALILLGVTIVLVELAGTITGVSPAAGIAFGTILGLTGFTTYNWLTQFDDETTYRALPVDTASVFRAKFDAFLVAGPTMAVATYVPVVAWQGAGWLESLVGVVMLLGVLGYILGVTVTLTGLSPNEFLFDVRRFTVFGLAMALPLVPILVIAFALPPLGGMALGILGVAGAGLGIIGVYLFRQAVPKWSVRYRRQTPLIE